MPDKSRFTALALSVIETEAQAIRALTQRIDTQFIKACELLLSCPGHVIVMGMGKSGHIGNKIAATLASTGTPAFFVHPSEAGHGDLGMVTAKDVVLAISYSGNTDSVLNLLPPLKQLSVPLIAMTGNPNSPLAQAANVHLSVAVSEEACPLGLAPTASSTATLVMGDALAITLLDARGFSAEDFARSHPSGSLGRRLLLRVCDLMHGGEAVPMVKLETSLSDALVEMTSKKLGLTCVCNNDGSLLGVFTDGDLRRTLDHHHEIKHLKMQDVMTPGCKTIEKNALAIEALTLMQTYQIMALVICDANQYPIGILHMHDLFQAGVT